MKKFNENILKNIFENSISNKKGNKEILLERMGLNEIDWDEEFSDVKKECIPPQQLAEYLNGVVGGEKLKTSQPHVSAKSIPMDDEGEIDVEAFIQEITKIPPKVLVTESEKMDKTSSDASVSVTIGIPALRGLVYDIENKEFYFVNTCPGAGSCAVVCYARKGRFIWASKSMKQTRVLNLLLNNPKMFKAKVKNEIEGELIRNMGIPMEFRWNDSGDFFTKKYFDIAQEITTELQEAGYDFKSYAYTKMGDIVNMNSNVTTNFSDDANKRETGKVDTAVAKKSMIVPKTMFKDLLIPKGSSYEKDERGKVKFRDESGKETLKDRISKEYNVPKETLLTYDEMMSTPEGDKNKYNVIIMPSGDGDVSAQRQDVQTTFLLQH
jgi:hypothetical protein